MLTPEDYRQRFLVLAQDEGFLTEVALADLNPRTTTAELGLTSVNVIQLLVQYLERNHNRILFDPEWVAYLEDVTGIVSVMSKVDALRTTEAAGR